MFINLYLFVNVYKWEDFFSLPNFLHDKKVPVNLGSGLFRAERFLSLFIV